ncbi:MULTISPECIES: hypothetical protein [Rhodonellum]|nr:MULTISPECIES: hypothetical protein [Rhodonellum]
MKGKRKYIPINCGYYDRLEAWATTKKTCAITYKNGDSTELVSTKILDLKLLDGIEYLFGENGFLLRLDDLVSIDGIPLEMGNCTF